MARTDDPLSLFQREQPHGTAKVPREVILEPVGKVRPPVYPTAALPLQIETRLRVLEKDVRALTSAVDGISKGTTIRRQWLARVTLALLILGAVAVGAALLATFGLWNLSFRGVPILR